MVCDAPAGIGDAGCHAFIQSTMTGVTTSAPARSPSHQVSQIGATFATSAKPARRSVSTPMLALMAVGRKLMSANRATPAGVSKVAQPSDQRLIR